MMTAADAALLGATLQTGQDDDTLAGIVNGLPEPIREKLEEVVAIIEAQNEINNDGP